MRAIFPSSPVPSFRLQPFHGQLLCRIFLHSSRFADPNHRREVVIVAAPTPPYLRHLIIYRQPVRDDPPRAA